MDAKLFEEERESFDERACRAAFLHFFVSLFLDFQAYIVYRDVSEDIACIEDIFDKEAFLESRPWGTKVNFIFGHVLIDRNL